MTSKFCPQGVVEGWDGLWPLKIISFFEPSQSLGWTKHFTTYKPKIIDPMMYIYIYIYIYFRGGVGKRVYGPSRLFHLF